MPRKTPLQFGRRFLLAAHELLLRRPTCRFARQLESTQWRSPMQLRAMQSSKLAQLLDHAWTNIPFYRARFEQAGIRPPKDPLTVLHRLPLLTKHDIRASLHAMTWHKSPGGLTQRSTGGSTGEPLTFYLDRRRQAYDQAARIRSHRWFGAEFGQCEILLWGSPLEQQRTDRARTFRDRLFNQHLLDAFQMSPQRMDHYCDEWNRLRPAALFGYPSSIALFARHARGSGIKLDCSRLRAVFVTGEVCYPQDRELIEQFFSVPLADGYGSREAGFIAHQCPHGGMHITAENVIVEIVAEGMPVPTGRQGEIVVTHLDNYGMPLIRYRTGDIGALKAGRCRCGRGLPLMEVVQGRSTDFLVLPDGTIKHALSIIYPLREMPGISRFRVSQSSDMAVSVELLKEQTAQGITVESVRHKVGPVLGDQVPLNIQFVDSISELPSGKFRYVVSHARPRQEAATT